MSIIAFWKKLGLWKKGVSVGSVLFLWNFFWVWLIFFNEGDALFEFLVISDRKAF